MVGRANLRTKEKTKRICRGLKQGKGRAKPKEKREKMDENGLKQGAGWANLRKKRENKWISRD